MRSTWIFLVATVAGVASPATHAHELWLHSRPGASDGVIRLTFGDGPDLSAAERVAEIAGAKVWADGKPLKVERLPDSLEAGPLQAQPAVLSAFADRGVVTHRGESSIIYLAAYAQSRAIEPNQAGNLGLRDDQVRLLLVSRPHGPPVVLTTWKGRPAANASMKIFHGHGDPTETQADSRGEIPCPDLMEGPWSLLVEVADKTAGQRDGRSYTEIRYKATLVIGAEAGFGPAIAACLARVKEVHGATGPWAVAGYRIGERALKELGLSRQSHELEVIHHSPAEVQYSCIADGVQAATGASPGKLNLRIEQATREELCTVIRDKQSGRGLTFTIKPEFARSMSNLAMERLEGEGRRVAAMPDDGIFQVVATK